VTTNNPPRYGHWQVSDRSYLNKLQSVVDAVPHGWWPHFYFQEKEFSSYDWLVEPPTDLSELYRHRARQLRTQYDHITIEFSGGADSWIALYSFLSAGLHVDAVYHKYSDAGTQGENDRSVKNQASEAKYQAWPWFKRFQELDPHIQWHLKYITDDIVQGWQTGALDPLEYNCLHVGYVTKIPSLITDVPGFIPSLGRNAIVYGTDKPNLFFENNKFYLYFNDTPIIHRAFIERSQLNLNIEDVLFFWDSECCDLLAKQAHIVMNWFKKNPKMLYLINNRSYRNTGLYYDIVNSLIYPDFRADWQSEKASGVHVMSHEAWFHNSSYNTAHGKNWHTSMNNMTNLIKNTLNNTEFSSFVQHEGNYARLPDGWSKMYCIGEL